MKFGNVALYCKGWYKVRGNVDKWWMDFVHCIDADGWTVQTKQDVATWCLHRLDELRNDPLFGYKHQLDLSYFFNEVNETIRRAKWYDIIDLSQEDAIIAVYRSIISNSPKEYFEDGGVKPNENVLPLSYREAWYDDGKYSHEPKLYPADMREDVMKRIDEMFPNHIDQEIKDGRFDEIESYIRNKSYKDVVVINGSNSLLTCKEVVLKGSNIKQHVYGDSVLFLGIYEYCNDIDPDKEYTVRIEGKPDYWGDIEYTVKSIK